jgi:diguanylate cyclase (GGDEF)-like protein
VRLGFDGTVDFANHAALRLFGREAVGCKFAELVDPADRLVVDGYLHSLQVTVDAGASRYMTCSLQRYGAQSVQIAITGASVQADGERGILLSLADITSQRERDAKLLSMALTDPLSGLANRRSFQTSLRAAINAGHGCVVALADIDRFKMVNDKFGHATGDRVLSAVASRLVGSLPANAVIARLGGDEFGVLIPGAVDDKSLRQLEALRQIDISAEMQSPGPQAVTLSIGVTHTTAGDENDVLRQSDVAMYAAKAGGRAQVAVFGEEASALLQQSQSITSLVENLRKQNERLHSEARTDARTGLANSRALSEVESVVVGAPDSAWTVSGVIFVDIDHFGAFNHLYGDHAGDEALKRVADALRRAGRKTDLVFRKGGEEFVMVLPMAEPDAVGRVAQYLAECIADLRIPHAEGPTGWLSALIVGVSVFPRETVGQAIVRAGNEAMRCKAKGTRAQVVLTE